MQAVQPHIQPSIMSPTCSPSSLFWLPLSSFNWCHLDDEPSYLDNGRCLLNILACHLYPLHSILCEDSRLIFVSVMILDCKPPKLTWANLSRNSIVHRISEVLKIGWKAEETSSGNWEESKKARKWGI